MSKFDIIRNTGEESWARTSFAFGARITHIHYHTVGAGCVCFCDHESYITRYVAKNQAGVTLNTDDWQAAKHFARS